MGQQLQSSYWVVLSSPNQAVKIPRQEGSAVDHVRGLLSRFEPFTNNVLMFRTTKVGIAVIQSQTVETVFMTGFFSSLFQRPLNSSQPPTQ